MTAFDTYILFELAGASYGLRSADVQHIEMIEHVTPVPNTAAAVDGLVFSRGKVVPALNLRVRFGLPREANSLRTRLIFLKFRERTVALIVDAAREFRKIETSSIRSMDETLQGINGNYLDGVATVAGRLVLLLNVEVVLNLDYGEALLTDVVPATPATT